MQNKKETKKTAKKPASTAAKTKRPQGQPKQKKALPAAKSDNTPIARLMAAASRAALPAISLASVDATKTTKKATAKKESSETKGKASGAKSKAAAKDKGQATANGKAKVADKANGKAKADNTVKASASNNAANTAGGKAKVASKPMVSSKAAATANGKALANEKTAAKKDAQAPQASNKAPKKSAASSAGNPTGSIKATANGKATPKKATANGKAAPIKEAQATTSDKAAPVDKATAAATKATSAKKSAKSSEAEKPAVKKGDASKASKTTTADGKAAAKKGAKATKTTKGAAGKSASTNKGKTQPAASSKADANSESAGAKASATGKTDANPKAKDAPASKKNRYVPAHQAPPANKIEAIKQLPATMRTKALMARDWVVENWRTPKFIAIVSVVALYVICSVVFSVFYLPGTTINGNDVSMRTTASITSQAEQTSKDYVLTVSGDGTNFSIKGNDVDLAFDADSFGKEAKGRLFGWAWPIGLLTPRGFDVGDGVSFNEDKVKELVKTAVDNVNKNATLPQNATIAYDANKGTFTAKEEKGGTALSNDTTWESVSRGLHDLKDHVELGNAELQQPTVTASSPQMNEALSHANSLGKKELPLTVNDKTAKTVDGALMSQWLTIDDSYNIVADLDLVTDWAKTDLSSEIDTAGTARTYTRTNDGKRIEVYGGGTYGWNMDGAKLAEAVCDRIANDSFEPLEIPMKSKGAVYVHGKQDWGPRYVDVDLTEQYVRMFDEDSNVVMESACVSGNLAENNDTVTGVFALEKKESPATLVGLDENGDGQPDYENEVQYWMPFYGGYGLHDALWRSYFGEDVYQYDGSHGCINLPYWAAELLYSYIRVGDTVVVHF